MAYDKKKIYNDALQIIEENHVFFIEHLVNYLPISKKTFYEWFPIDSYECDTIKDLLDKNKTESCNTAISKWLKSGNPTLEIAAYKQICSDEQRKALSTNWNENNNTGSLTIVWNEERTYEK